MNEVNKRDSHIEGIWLLLFSLFFGCIVFSNVKVFSVLGADIKPIHLVMLLITVYCAAQYRIIGKHFLVGVFFVILPIFPLYRLSSPLEWMKSYVIYAIIVLFCIFALRPMSSAFRRNKEIYLRLFFACLVFVEVLGVLQFVCMNFLNYFFLRGIFGRFQFQPNRFGIDMGFYRAYSLYYEPSYFAWVINAGLACLLYIAPDRFKFKHLALFLLSGIAMIVTISSSGWVFYFMIIVVYFFVRTKEKIVFIAVMLIVAIMVLVIWKTTDLLRPLDRIVYELQTENTSGYERYVTPLLYFRKTMSLYPIFGRGLGHEGNMDAVGIIGAYATIHNAVVGFCVCFGMTSLIYIIPGIKLIISKLKENQRFWILIMLLVSIYTTTGAFVSLDTFIFVVVVAVISGKEDMNIQLESSGIAERIR